MNELTAADILAAELNLLATLALILVSGVCALVATVMFGVWRLCVGCASSDRSPGLGVRVG